MARSGAAGKNDNSIKRLMPEKSEEAPKVKPEQRSTRSALRLDFSNEGLLNAIVMAEVLGKPKCLKRGRR